MQGADATKRLGQIKPGELERLETLIAEIRSESRRPMEAVSQMWVSRAEGEAKPKAVLNALEELAVVSWLSAGQAVDGQRRLEAVGQACNAYLAFQERIIEKLTAMLDSKDRIPEPKMIEPIEEKEQPARECDEGYLLLRRLLKANESEAAHEYVRRIFLDQTEAEADTTINRYRKRDQWDDLMEEEDVAEVEDVR